MTVLVLRALGLGDFLTGLPALALLRRALPDEQITLALPRELHELARLAGTVDATVHAHELDPIENAPCHPDLAIDLHGNGPASRRLLLEHAPRRLLAYTLDGSSGSPQWRANEHEVHRWCRLIGSALHIPERDWPGIAGILPVPPGQDVPDDVTVVHVGAKSAARRWPPERFAALAIMLCAQGHRPVVTGGPSERALVAEVARAARVEDAGPLTLSALLALVARARLVVSGDTGVAHAAATYRTPSVTLFGPVSPAIWGPPSHPRHQVVWHGYGTGDPHGATPDPALLAVTVAEAITACRRAVGYGSGEQGQRGTADVQLCPPGSGDPGPLGAIARSGDRGRQRLDGQYPRVAG